MWSGRGVPNINPFFECLRPLVPCEAFAFSTFPPFCANTLLNQRPKRQQKQKQNNLGTVTTVGGSNRRVCYLFFLCVDYGWHRMEKAREEGGDAH